MKFTNKYNLPEAIVQAIANREYSKGEADYSVTELLRPPQMARLLQIYGGQIEVDIADSIWALFGTAVHYILSKNSLENHTIEERLILPIGKTKISGQPDVIINAEDGAGITIQDYKVTSVYKFLSKDFSDWEFQLNMYKFIAETSKNLPVHSLQIIAILRDWSRSERKKAERDGKEYPDVQVQKIDMPIWGVGKVLHELGQRLDIMEQVKKITDIEKLSQDFPCTKEDRWAQNDAYLVIKNSGYVYRRFETDGTEAGKLTAGAMARETLAGMKAEGYEVKFVEGYSLRCEEYCPVKDFCFQRNGKKPEVNLEPTALPIDIKQIIGE